MTIDGVNILTTYSATLLYGSLNSLIEYPDIKPPKKNDWAEYDGIEVDLSNPVLDKRNVTLTFLILEDKIDSFVTFLLAKTYRDYYSKDLNYTFTLRCLEIVDIDKTQPKFAIKIKLSDDFPLKDYVYEGLSRIIYFSSTTITWDRTDIFFGQSSTDYGFVIDDISSSAYGILLLEETNDSLDSSAKTKNKLEIESNFISGVFVAEQASKKKEYSATLDLFFKESVVNFMKGYNAFLYNLIKPENRILAINGKTYNFYYDKSKVITLIVINNVVWCNFEVNIVLI